MANISKKAKSTLDQKNTRKTSVEPEDKCYGLSELNSLVLEISDLTNSKQTSNSQSLSNVEQDKKKSLSDVEKSQTLQQDKSFSRTSQESNTPNAQDSCSKVQDTTESNHKGQHKQSQKTALNSVAPKVADTQQVALTDESSHNLAQDDSADLKISAVDTKAQTDAQNQANLSTVLTQDGSDLQTSSLQQTEQLTVAKANLDKTIADGLKSKHIDPQQQQKALDVDALGAGADEDNSSLSGRISTDSDVIANENETVLLQHESLASFSEQKINLDAEQVLNKVDKSHLSADTESYKLHHVSGKTFDLSEILPEIKILSASEQERINQDFLSGFNGKLNQLLNYRKFERMGGSEFGVLSVKEIQQLIKKCRGKLTEKTIMNIYKKCLDVSEGYIILDKYKACFALQNLEFNFNEPCEILRFTESYFSQFSGNEELELCQLRREVQRRYLDHEVLIAKTFKEYNFDPTTQEYQELVFYYYLLTVRTNSEEHFKIYSMLVDLQNLYTLFKLIVGSFVSYSDFSSISSFGQAGLEHLSTYTHPSKLYTSEVSILHFSYLLKPLKQNLMDNAPQVLEWLNNLVNIGMKDVKSRYFSEGMPFDMSFVPTVSSYLLGLVTCEQGKGALHTIESVQDDPEHRPMMYYDILCNPEQNTSEKIVEYKLAMQDIGSYVHAAIKNNEITPQMQEWAIHLCHQKDIFSTLDVLNAGAFNIFSTSSLISCSKLAKHRYYEQMAFNSKYRINLERKKQFIQDKINYHLDLVKAGKYDEAFANPCLKEAHAYFQKVCVLHIQSFNNTQSSSTAKSTKDVGSFDVHKQTNQKALPKLQQNSDILKFSPLTRKELVTLIDLFTQAFNAYLDEHLAVGCYMDLEKGQFIGDYGHIPLIPGASAHTAFLIGRALHYGDFGVSNENIAKVAYSYADLSGHYLASMFLANLEHGLFDPVLNKHGELYAAYMMRAVFAGCLTAYSDVCLYGKKYSFEESTDSMVTNYPFGVECSGLDKNFEKNLPFAFTLNEGLFPQYQNHGGISGLGGLHNVAGFNFKERVVRGDADAFYQYKINRTLGIGGCADLESLQMHRVMHIFRNKTMLFIQHEYDETYYQAISINSDEYDKVFRKLNPVFGLRQADEGEPIEPTNQYQIVLSNAIIFLLDLVDDQPKLFNTYSSALYNLITQLFHIMQRTCSPVCCLAAFKVLTSSRIIEAISQDVHFSKFLETSTLSRLIVVQLIDLPLQNLLFESLLSKGPDAQDVASIFLQIAMCQPYLREQGYNLFDNNLKQSLGNFTPCRIPYLDEMVKTSAALHNGNSISYMSSISRVNQQQERSELFALVGVMNNSIKTYRDVVRYFIKYDLYKMRFDTARTMVLLRQPYGYYEMYLCLKEQSGREAEAHTWLYYAACLNVAEAKHDYHALEAEKLFKPLPFLIYYMYLKKLAPESLSALICTMLLTIDNALVPGNFTEYLKVVETYQSTFSNTQIKNLLVSYGIIDPYRSSRLFEFSKILNLFPEESEAVQTTSEAINGNFVEFLNMQSKYEFMLHSSDVSSLNAELCDAKVRVLLTSMFDTLSAGKTLLESLVLLNWTRSQTFPFFLNEKRAELVESPIMLMANMDAASLEMLNSWMIYEKETSSIRDSEDWGLSVPTDSTQTTEIECICEKIWLKGKTQPSRSLMQASALVSLNSYQGRPYPMIFRSICRYLGNSGELEARRFTLLNFSYMSVVPYGESFEQCIGQPRRSLICNLARKQKGLSFSTTQQHAFEQSKKYFRAHKQDFHYDFVQDQNVALQNDDNQSNQLNKQDYAYDKDMLLHDEHLDMYQSQVNEHEQQDKSAFDEHNLEIEVGSPGIRIDKAMQGSNELLNYAYYMMWHGNVNMLTTLVCMRNGWQLTRKANGPKRSYSSYLAKDLMRNEPGAFYRYLYYVQSHYFKYDFNDMFIGEDSKSSTARKFVCDVLQLNINGSKFRKFLDGMRNEGVDEFESLLYYADNGYIQGRYRVVSPQGEIDIMSGWRDIFFANEEHLNLSTEQAIAARESLKEIAARIDRLSDIASGEKVSALSSLQEGTESSKEAKLNADTSKTRANSKSQVANKKAAPSKRQVAFANVDEVQNTYTSKLQYGSIEVTRELLQDPKLNQFLGVEVSRLKDATVSKQWINYTFYPEKCKDGQHKMLQLLPYSNAIVDSCIRSNVGGALVRANQINAQRGKIDLVYEPRRVQWNCTADMIRKEEQFDPYKLTTDHVLKEYGHTYNNAFYQIDRARLHMLRQAPVTPNSLNVTIEAQATWATLNSKLSDLRKNHPDLAPSAFRPDLMSITAQNALISEDGYDSKLENRLLEAYYKQGTITDDIFYVSEQSYYKELLHRVAEAVEKEPQLLNLTGPLGAILDIDPQNFDLTSGSENLRFDAAATINEILEPQESLTVSKVSETTDSLEEISLAHNNLSLKNQDASAALDSEDLISNISKDASKKLSSTQSSEDLAAIENLKQLVKQVASDSNMEGDALVDAVINENRSNEVILLSNLQSFLSDKMGSVVPQFEGVVQSNKPHARDELDVEEEPVSKAFNKLWSFDESQEYQFTRPKMFHEDENPLHTYIYTFLNLLQSEENLVNQVKCCSFFANRLYTKHHYFFGACDVVDSCLMPLVIESFKRRYYRIASNVLFVNEFFYQARNKLYKIMDELMLNKESLSDDMNDTLPSGLINFLDLSPDTTFFDFCRSEFSESFQSLLMFDPHYRALAEATREQVEKHPEVLTDDSFLGQFFYDFMCDPDLLEHSKKLQGDCVSKNIQALHSAIWAMHNEKNCQDSPFPPLPLIRAKCKLDYSMYYRNNKEPLQLDKDWFNRACIFMSNYDPDSIDVVEDLEDFYHLDNIHLNYVTDYEKQWLDIAISKDPDLISKLRELDDKSSFELNDPLPHNLFYPDINKLLIDEYDEEDEDEVEDFKFMICSPYGRILVGDDLDYMLKHLSLIDPRILKMKENVDPIKFLENQGYFVMTNDMADIVFNNEDYEDYEDEEDEAYVATKAKAKTRASTAKAKQNSREPSTAKSKQNAGSQSKAPSAKPKATTTSSTAKTKRTSGQSRKPRK